MIKNRNVRNHAQNKVGHHDPEMGHSTYTQRSFLYVSINSYNKLPRNITLIKEHHLFKKWVKKYNLNNNIKLKEQEDNNQVYVQQVINYDLINICQEYNT